MDKSVAENNQLDRFIERWKSSGGNERASYQLFLVEPL